MGEVPSYTWWYGPDAPQSRTITVLPLRENKRPIGFAPWPEEEVTPATPPKRKKKAKRK